MSPAHPDGWLTLAHVRFGPFAVLARGKLSPSTALLTTGHVNALSPGTLFGLTPLILGWLEHHSANR